MPAFPLKAADFIARGVEKGPVLGAVLRAAEEAWIAAGFPTEVTAFKFIVSVVAQATRRRNEKPRRTARGLIRNVRMIRTCSSRQR